jgi:dynein heavy chain
MLLRHGLIVVGAPLSGKTTIVTAVSRALCLLNERGLQNERAVTVNTVNPKAVYTSQLYGQFDAVSHDWHDGILAKMFRCGCPSRVSSISSLTNLSASHLSGPWEGCHAL